MKYEVVVPGEPKGWKASTVTRHKRGKKSFTVAHKDENLRIYQGKVAALAVEQIGGPPIDGPCVVEINAFFSRPKRLMRKKDPEGPVPCTKTPDRVNIVKAVEDGLNGIAWVDDKYVFSGIATKWYHEKGGVPRVEVTIRSWEPDGPVATLPERARRVLFGEEQ